MIRMNKFNQEGYRDPTPQKALENIKHEVPKPVHLVIMGEPRAQGRPRFARHGEYVTTYDPKKSKDYKARIFNEAWLQLAQRKIKRFEDGRPLHVTVLVFRGVPKSWPKWKKEAALAGKIWPTSKPDTDNYFKIALDGLNRSLFHDDSVVVSIEAQKRYSDQPRMEITISQIG